LSLVIGQSVIVCHCVIHTTYCHIYINNSL